MASAGLTYGVAPAFRPSVGQCRGHGMQSARDHDGLRLCGRDVTWASPCDCFKWIFGCQPGAKEREALHMHKALRYLKKNVFLGLQRLGSHSAFEWRSEP